MKLHLTNIAALRPGEPGTYLDNATPGFGVCVGKNRKTWIVMGGQIRQRVRIGHYLRCHWRKLAREPKKFLIEAPILQAEAAAGM